MPTIPTNIRKAVSNRQPNNSTDQHSFFHTNTPETQSPGTQKSLIQQNASVALQTQEYGIASPSAGSPLPISGTDPIAAAAASIVSAGAAQQTSLGGGGGVIGGPNTVLRVIVESLMYPVSLDILHQIFQRFGKVLKIVTFTKNNSFQVRENIFFTSRELFN